jgi:hypothetical protein
MVKVTGSTAAAVGGTAVAGTEVAGAEVAAGGGVAAVPPQALRAMEAIATTPMQTENILRFIFSSFLVECM